MRVLLLKSCIMCAFSIAISADSSAQKSPLWGRLEAGRYEVGFRVLNKYDLSRPAIPDQDVHGKIVRSFPGVEGRQLQLCVWYPAKTTGARMSYEDYIFEQVKELDFSSHTAESKKLAVDQYITRFREESNPKFTEADMQKFSTLPMGAIRDAPSADGRFPVVLYPAYKTPAGIGIMSEFLASHGYVVVSTSMKGNATNLPEVSVLGIESQVNDLSFVLNEVKKLAFVDKGRVGVMAVGFNATASLAWVTRVRSVGAFVSLDGGVLVQNEKRMLQLTPYYDPSVITQPMLLIHTIHPDVSPATVDDYKYAERYFVRFLTMREFDFTDLGMLESINPGMSGTPNGDTQAGFEWASRYVLNFLDATLKGDTKSSQFIARIPSANGVATGILESNTKGALPATPTLNDLKVLIAESGVNGLTGRYDNLRKVDPQPFSQKVLADLFNWLGYLRDPDYVIRTELARIWLECYPVSARGHFLTARVSSAGGNKSKVEAHYRQALELLEADSDPFLDNNTRIRIRTVATEELAKIK